MVPGGSFVLIVICKVGYLGTSFLSACNLVCNGVFLFVFSSTWYFFLFFGYARFRILIILSLYLFLVG